MDTGATAGTGTAPPPVGLPEGTSRELLRLGGGAAQLHLLCGGADESVPRVRCGGFVVVAARRAGSPLSLLGCAVGELQWPLAGDSPVLRVGPRKFSFAFPGFFYGLTLPEGCADGELAALITILKTFCNYQDHAGERDDDFCSRDSEVEFWAMAYAKIRSLSVGAAPPPPLNAAGREQTAAKMQRALRASAATKLVAKVLLQDAIDPGRHIELAGGAAAPGGRPYVLAGIRAVSDVVDAVEAARGIGVGSWSPASEQWLPPPERRAYWHFNVAGLTLVLRAVAAVTARAGRLAGQGTGGHRSAAALAGQPGGETRTMVENQSYRLPTSVRPSMS